MQCRTREERGNSYGIILGPSQDGTESRPQQFYFSVLHGLGKTSGHGSSTRASTRKHLQNYGFYHTALWLPSLSHRVCNCMALVLKTKSCSQLLLLIFAVIRVSQPLELM